MFTPTRTVEASAHAVTDSLGCCGLMPAGHMQSFFFWEKAFLLQFLLQRHLISPVLAEKDVITLLLFLF